MECLLCCFFFFKQKTAYEMRISDWSSDVCSSDLPWTPPLRSGRRVPTGPIASRQEGDQTCHRRHQTALLADTASASSSAATARCAKIGRASCRERVCQYV